MAEDVAKPSPSKSSNRLNALGKLTALLGLPLLIIGGLFGGGLWYGATHSYRITSLQAQFLGFAEPEGATWSPPGALPPAAEGETKGEEPAGESGADTKAESGGAEAGEGGEPPKPEPTDPKPKPEPAEPQPTPPNEPGLAVAAASPVDAELRASFDAPLVVRVKLLVDPALAVAREDWLTYVAEVFAASDESFEALFGVELRLQGVVLWDSVPGADPEALLADLRTHEREGAEVVLGVLARPAPGAFTPASWTAEVHGDHGLVFADLERDDRYYQNMLRTLAGLLGASPTTEEAAAKLGSFMSLSGTPEGQPPVLDPVNRSQVINHKRRPFVDSRESAPREGETEPDTDSEPAEDGGAEAPGPDDEPEGTKQEI